MLKVWLPSPPVPTMSTRVGFVRDLHLGRKLAHHLRSGGNFADGFLFDAQAGNDGCHHDGRHLAGHDLAHQMQHLVVKDFTVFDGALQGLLGGDFDGVRHELTP